jgi:MiaB-like tRNA modifying enzyme
MHVFVKSVGCSANLADGEVLAGCLAEAGYRLVDSVDAADLVVYNTCAVKGPTENRAIESLKRIPSKKKLIVTGCLPSINFKRLYNEVRFDGVAGPAVGDRIVEIVNRVSRGERVVALDRTSDAKPSLDLPRSQRSSVISIVPVSYGCLGSCAYCCVVLARGHLRSYGVREIVSRIRKDLARGLREFWITSQDVACYGRDEGTGLVELLQAVDRIEGDFKIRVGMMTPHIVVNMLEDLVQAFDSEHIFKFIHLPVQSGDNQTLKRMRRFYSVEDFRKIINTFRARFPDITLATDFICGFPGESQKAFERSLTLIEEVRPDVVNVSKFFARPGTLAAGMEGYFVSLAEIRRRSRMMAELARKVGSETNRGWTGWTGEILIDEKGKIPGSWVGRNFAYKPIAVKSADSLMGKTLKVRVVRAFPTHLEGNVVE